MPKKEFIFQAKFDTSDFDKSIESLQKKLKEVSEPQSRGRDTAQRMEKMGLGASDETLSQFRRATQSAKRELDQLIKDQFKGQQDLGKELAKSGNALNAMVNKQRDMVRGSKEELEIVREIGKLKEQQAANAERYKKSDKVLNDALDQREGMDKDRFGPGGGFGLMKRFASQGMYGAAARTGGRMFMQNPGQNAFNGIAGAAGFIGAAGKIAEGYTGYGMRLEEARGSAIQNTTGKDLERVYEGKSPFEAAFLPERNQAAGMAEQKSDRNRWTDRMKGIGSAGLIAGGVIAGGAAIAGAPFTLGASTVGLPAAGAMIAGGMYGLSNDRSRQGVFGGKEYEQLLASQKAKDFRSQYDALKDQDPQKKLAMEKFERDYMKNSEFQRTLGINNEQFYGNNGFQARGAKAGFMPEQMMGMASSILGAGGSSRMGQESDYALKLQRQGYNNAGSLLGTLSGGTSTEASKTATINIISEAFKIGLDNTQFAEENRRFTQAAANVIAKSGASSEDDQNRIAQMMGQFLGDRTNMGVQAAQGAYEKSQERGSQLGGRRGTKRFVAAMQDPALSKIPSDDLTELLGMRPDQLKENNETVAYFADMAGVTPQELIEKLAGKEGINRKTRFNLPGNEDKVKGFSEVVNKYMDENDLTYSQLGELQEQGKLPQNVSVAYGGMQVAQNKEEKEQLTTRESRAAAGEFVEGTPMAAPGKNDFNKPPNKIEDIFTALGGEAADKARIAFNELRPALEGIGTAADAVKTKVSQTAGELNAEAARRRGTQPVGDGIDIGGVGNIMAPRAVQQPQGNKVKSP